MFNYCKQSSSLAVTLFWLSHTTTVKGIQHLKNWDELKVAKGRYQMAMIRRSWQRDINTGCSVSNTWFITTISFFKSKVAGSVISWCYEARSERQVANPDFKLLKRHKINIKSREVRQKDISAIAKTHLTSKR